MQIFGTFFAWFSLVSNKIKSKTRICCLKYLSLSGSRNFCYRIVKGLEELVPFDNVQGRICFVVSLVVICEVDNVVIVLRDLLPPTVC